MKVTSGCKSSRNVKSDHVVRLSVLYIKVGGIWSDNDCDHLLQVSACRLSIVASTAAAAAAPSVATSVRHCGLISGGRRTDRQTDWGRHCPSLLFLFAFYFPPGNFRLTICQGGRREPGRRRGEPFKLDPDRRAASAYLLLKVGDMQVWHTSLAPL